MGLVSCPECHRHIRRNERACPFCAADVAERVARIPERALPSQRLSRAALMSFAALGAGATMGAVGCSSNDHSTQSHYRAPPIVSGDAGGSPSTGGTAAGSGGAPAASGGSTPSATGGATAVPAYGLPVPP